MAIPSQSSSTRLDFYSYKIKIMTLIPLLQDTRSSAGEKSDIPESPMQTLIPLWTSHLNFPLKAGQHASGFAKWGWIIDWHGRINTLNQSHPGVILLKQLSETRSDFGPSPEPRFCLDLCSYSGCPLWVQNFRWHLSLADSFEKTVRQAEEIHRRVKNEC